MRISIVTTESRETHQRTVSSHIFNSSQEGSLQDNVVGIDRSVEFANVAMVGIDILDMFFGQP